MDNEPGDTGIKLPLLGAWLRDRSASQVFWEMGMVLVTTSQGSCAN